MIKTFPATKEGDDKMEEWLNEIAVNKPIERIYTTHIVEDEFKERTKDSKKVEDKVQTSKIQVVVHFK